MSNEEKPEGIQTTLHAVLSELIKLRKVINDAAERIAPSPKYVQLNPQGQVVDGRVQILPQDRKAMIKVEIPSVEPAPPPVITFCGEDYYFAGEESRYCNGGALYWTGTYKLKKKGG